MKTNKTNANNKLQEDISKMFMESYRLMRSESSKKAWQRRKERLSTSKLAVNQSKV